MSAFKNAIKQAIAQHRFHYRDQPWRSRDMIATLETLLIQAENTDQAIYQTLIDHVEQWPKESRRLRQLITNVLAVYEHSIQAQSISVLDTASESTVDDLDLQDATLSHQSGRVSAIGYNADTQLHVIQITTQRRGAQTYFIRDTAYQYAATTRVNQSIRPGQTLLRKRSVLSEYQALQPNPRDRLLSGLSSKVGYSVESLVEPASFNPEGEVILRLKDHSLITLSLQGQPLFIGDVEQMVHDEEIPFTLQTDEATEATTERYVSVRFWQKPWQSVLLNEQSHLATRQRHKILIAFHGIFDHKGAYQALALTLLAESKSVDPMTVVAVDWPTYGTSRDRGEATPRSEVMKQYLLAVVEHCAQRFPEAELYLLGESLGATMILIAGEALEALRTQYANLKGAVLISPALHHPQHSLYFQNRPMHASAPLKTFADIWFNDPEVNRANFIMQLNTVIPYLTQAYEAAVHWPSDMPCAVLLASKDSVISLGSVIALSDTLTQESIVFYGFPARHLILRSQSEGGQYIEGELIRRDIAALLTLMGNDQFSKNTSLPHSGATSAESMQWYRKAYHTHLWRSGYLNSWPTNHTALVKQGASDSASAKRDSEKSEAAAQGASTYLGLLPDQATGLELLEHPVVGDGDCGFHVLGTTRAQFVDVLLPLAHDETARQALAPEIRNTILSDDLSAHLKLAPWVDQQAQYQAAWATLEVLMARLKSTIESAYPGEFGLAERVAWLQERVTEETDHTELAAAYHAFANLSAALDAYCQQPEVFITYLGLYRIPNTLWLGDQSALLWAKQQQISLTLWQQAAHHQRLTVRESYQAPDERGAIHMLHTGGFTHFNLLECVRVRDLTQEQQQVITWNQTETVFSTEKSTLFTLFFEQAMQTPDAMAVLTAQHRFSYAEIQQRANRVAHALKASGAEPNGLVAIVMEKGWEQVVACLGVLQAGAAFLPIDPHWPVARVQEVLARGKGFLALTQQAQLDRFQDTDLFDGFTCFAVDDEVTWAGYSDDLLVEPQQPDDIAYVIFTSGSTGQPKGVIISHRAAVNTITDINQRFQVSSEDRILGLSNLSFDLAIYDLFGMLAVGGAVVLPEADQLKEPAHWLALITHHTITLWNTVSMLMQMLLDYVEHLPSTEHTNWQATLRLVLLSGDWIPLDLPPRIQGNFPASQTISLGGATEGSIWSILYPITHVDPNWKSIPYGRPMANQAMYILDEQWIHCPIGILGDLYIGGVGVALGYWQDEVKTAASFIVHPQTRERLYKTGDRGRWLAEGVIEFGGREDTQVKVSGYRIELGEIEAVLNQHPRIQQSVVVAHQRGTQKQLVSYLVPQADETIALVEASHKESKEEEQKKQKKQKEKEEKENHAQEWQKVYESLYQTSNTPDDPTFNIAGWISSYTHAPIPQQAMQEWVGDTVQRILALQPKRVLEIGCGTGLLVSRIAPHCETYVATDIASTAIQSIEQLKSADPRLAHVVTEQRAAEELAALNDAPFDVIVINSVIQCFPTVDTLVELIRSAVPLLKEGKGSLFIGDVRHFPTLRAFHASVALERADEQATRETLQQHVQMRCDQEEELLLDPEFFETLPQHLPDIARVQIQLKQGSCANELNCFRYDVVLHVGQKPTQRCLPQWCNLQDYSLTLDTIRQHLQQWCIADTGEAFRALGFRALPNARLQMALATEQWLQGRIATKITTATAFKAHVQSLKTKGIDPHELYQLARELNLSVEIRWQSGNAEGAFDAVFTDPIHGDSAERIIVDWCDAPKSLKPWAAYGNQPLKVKQRRELIPQIQVFLETKLPPYMLPTHYLLLDRLPLSANGKVDRQALPLPDSGVGHSTPNNLESRSFLEQTLVSLWCEILGLEQVGLTDDFFQLGGNSLLAVRIITQINEQLRVKLAVSVLFSHSSIDQLAQVIARAQQIDRYQPLMAFNPEGKRPPLFFVHSGRGSAEAYVTLANHFDQDQPVYVVESYNLCSHQPFLTTVEAMATQYIGYIQTIQPHGPYRLGGWSQGGLVAYEMAQQLMRQGEAIHTLYFLDTFLYNYLECQIFRGGMERFLQNDPFYQRLPMPYRDHVRNVDRSQTIAMLNYRPQPYTGRVVLLKAMERWSFIETPELRWGRIVKAHMYHAFSKRHNGWSKYIRHLEMHQVSGHHQSIMEGEHAQAMANIIQTDVLTRSQGKSDSDIESHAGSQRFFQIHKGTDVQPEEARVEQTGTTRKGCCCRIL